MKTFNSFVKTITFASAMAISLVSLAEDATTNAMLNKDAMADTNTHSDHMMDTNNSAMPSNNQVPIQAESDNSSMETMPKDDSKMPAYTDKTITTTTTDTEKTSTDTSSTDDTTPWYKKWLARLGM